MSSGESESLKSWKSAHSETVPEERERENTRHIANHRRLYKTYDVLYKGYIRNVSAHTRQIDFDKRVWLEIEDVVYDIHTICQYA